VKFVALHIEVLGCRIPFKKTFNGKIAEELLKRLQAEQLYEVLRFLRVHEGLHPKVELYLNLKELFYSSSTMDMKVRRLLYDAKEILEEELLVSPGDLPSLVYNVDYELTDEEKETVCIEALRKLQNQRKTPLRTFKDTDFHIEISETAIKLLGLDRNHNTTSEIYHYALDAGIVAEDECIEKPIYRAYRWREKYGTIKGYATWVRLKLTEKGREKLRRRRRNG